MAKATASSTRSTTWQPYRGERLRPFEPLTRTHTQIFNTLNQLWKDVGAAGTAAVTTVFGYDTNGNQTCMPRRSRGPPGICTTS